MTITESPSAASIKRLGIVKADKSEVKYSIDNLDDIYTHADELKSEAGRFVTEVEG